MPPLKCWWGIEIINMQCLTGVSHTRGQLKVDLTVISSLSRVRLFETSWAAACQASLSITNSWSLFKLMSIESVMPSNHLILCHPLLLPSIFPSTRVFSDESVLRFRWPKYWSFSFSISLPMNVQDWFPLGLTGLIYLKSKGLFKSLQHSSANASIIWHSAFFIVQLLHPYMTTGKTWVSTRQTFVGKVMPLLFNMLSRLVIAFLPGSKHLLISWLQSPSAVIFWSLEKESLSLFPLSAHLFAMKGWDRKPWC